MRRCIFTRQSRRRKSTTASPGVACVRSNGCSTQASVDARWCIVHATHMTEKDVAALAASGAVAGLAPTTEADLGDGTFPGAAYLRAAAASVSAATRTRSSIPSRNCASSSGRSGCARASATCWPSPGDATIGTTLWSRAAQGGAQALAQPIGAIEAGRRADLVVLNGDDPALAGQAPEDVLDAAIFGPCRAPVRDVMAGAVGRPRRPARGRSGDLRSLSRRACAVGSAAMTAMSFDLLLVGRAPGNDAPRRAVRRVRDGALGVRGGVIAWVGSRADLPRDVTARDAALRWALADAGADRLPYAPGLRRQSRRRIRAR